MLFTLIITVSSVSPAAAVSPSNTGLVGLWEYPTADMPGDGRGWISYSDYFPYRTGSVSLGLFPWFEFNIRLSEFETAAIISDGYGHYKDKTIDLKLLLMNQKGLRPAVAVGAFDIAEQAVRKAYFAVGTWRYKDLALTLGYATEAYNGLYGGLSWEPWEWLEVKAEYSPLDYKQDVISGTSLHPEEASSKYNYGLVIKSPWGLNGSLSYQRGEEFCFGLNYQFDLTKPVFGEKNKPDISIPISTDWADTDIPQMAVTLQSALGRKGYGLRNVVVLAGDHKVHTAFENIGYSSQAEGTARAIILAAHMIPWDTKTFSCSVMVRGNPVSRIELNTEQLALIRLKKINEYDIQNSAITWAPNTKYGTLPDESWDTMAGPGSSINNGTAQVSVALAYEPRIDRSTQDDYMARLDIDYIGQLRSSSGWEAYLKVRQPINNNVDIWWQPEMNDTTRIWKGVLSLSHKFDKNFWAIAEAGWLDENYFGGNLWARYYVENSPIWIGGRLSVIKERAFDSFSGTSDYKRENGNDNDWETAYWAEVGYHDTTYNADIIARYGTFADGDKGYRVDAIRNWNDTSIGFYFTDTDRKTSGRNYTDAGMLLHIPISAWCAEIPNNTYWEQEFTMLSNRRLFAGVMPGAWMTPERLLGELAPNRLIQELGFTMNMLMLTLDDEAQPEYIPNRIYGILEYATDEWRKNEVIAESE